MKGFVEVLAMERTKNRDKMVGDDDISSSLLPSWLHVYDNICSCYMPMTFNYSCQSILFSLIMSKWHIKNHMLKDK